VLETDEQCIAHERDGDDEDHEAQPPIEAPPEEHGPDGESERQHAPQDRRGPRSTQPAERRGRGLADQLGGLRQSGGCRRGGGSGTPVEVRGDDEAGRRAVAGVTCRERQRVLARGRAEDGDIGRGNDLATRYRVLEQALRREDVDVVAGC